MDVELVYIDEFLQWPQLADGSIHMCLENWPSGHIADEEKYIITDKTVSLAGPLGVIGQIGWYTQEFVLKEEPRTAVSYFYDNPTVTSVFNNTFYGGSSTWTTYESQIISTSNYSLEVVYLGGEEQILQKLIESTTATVKQPMLFYFWTPHGVFADYSLFRVALPQFAENNYYPPDILTKVIHSKLKEISPSAYFLATTFTLKSLDQIQMLAEIRKGRSVYEVSCNWVRNNTQTWKNWIEPLPNLRAFVSWTSPIGLVSAIFSGIVIVFALVIWVILWIFKDHHVVVAGGFVLMQMILFGIILMAITPFGLLGYAYSWNCVFSVFIFGIGFAICWGTVLLKEYRLFTIFKKAKKLKRATGYSDLYILKLLLPFILIEVIIDLVWVLATPMKAPYGYCVQTSTVMLTIFIFYKGFLILVNCFFAFKTRNLSTTFSESQALSVGIYGFSVVLVIVLILTIFLPIEGTIFALSVGLCVALLTFLCSVFLTRIYHFWDEEKSTSTENKSPNTIHSVKSNTTDP
eukprot:TRINITY_DN16033_c0_g1_i1.p1 TRINITY_DN16033_c0_g1~~TRINITY_DN16033_c0_g1_i1.p1  ORF type:complete len:600 (-),score=107.75 TRINITY_DN16033_c0_g1_i1:10-1566(-)